MKSVHSLTIWFLVTLFMVSWPGTLTGAPLEEQEIHEAMDLFLISQVQRDEETMITQIAPADDLQIIVESEELHPANPQQMAEFVQHELGGSASAVLDNVQLVLDDDDAVLAADWILVWDYGSEFEQFTLPTEFHWRRLDGTWQLYKLDIQGYEMQVVDKPLYPKPYFHYDNEFFSIQYPSTYSLSEDGEWIMLDTVIHRQQVTIVPGGSDQGSHERLTVDVHDLEYASAAEAAAAFSNEDEEIKANYQLIDEITVEVAGMEVPGHQYSYEFMDRTTEMVRFFVAGDDILLAIYGPVIGDGVTQSRLERLLSTLELHQ